ncbi:MAG: ABC transporter substrate-binding protein [Oscillatoriales cyanobacterium SM2_2_1]|nr:ABC transporter substrate-binding protein [Oscillatoriales cyanobacterium SM2_2_1]
MNHKGNQEPHSKVSRRHFLWTAGASTLGAVALNACGSEPPASTTPTATETPAAVVTPAVTPGTTLTPEVTTAKLGFIALTDSCPLIIAKVKGYFEKYGMKDVEVTKQASWAVTRDNIVLGSGGGGIDGAHILTPMPYLISEGIVTNGKKVPMFILARLNVNGQGICLSKDYEGQGFTTEATGLKDAVAKNKAAGKSPKAAVTFPGGTHDLWMRYWLSANGIEPNKDIELIVVPPAQMIANVKAGNMDAFCVGEPWPLQLVNQKLGYNALTTGEFWKDHPEKAFAMRADWVDKHPKAAQAMLMAVQEAQIWCDDLANAQELCEILSQREWVNAPVKDIIDRTKGNYDFGDGRKLENSDLRQTYWNRASSFPFKSHDLWFVTEDIRWGYFPTSTDAKALVERVNREDIWKEAAKAIGQAAAIPPSSSRGVETFFDKVTFDPENPEAYLKSLKLKSLREV